ncbi:MAG: Mut7-C RNAse domain-containing protein [Chloroflexota bacterium]|nr:Mut7-C RNAse domain-containing protein [Chloroflexota bacterium]
MLIPGSPELILPDSSVLPSMRNCASPRLLADCMLGRLAKWLRLLGYDTAYENEATDHELARRARAEGRVLLTRDRDLAARRGLESLLIQSEHLEQQIEEVREALGLPSAPSLSRCPVCNVVLERSSPNEVADRVPPYVLETHTEFRRCPECGRIYWSGSHVDAMNEQLKDFSP